MTDEMKYLYVVESPDSSEWIGWEKEPIGWLREGAQMFECEKELIGWMLEEADWLSTGRSGLIEYGKELIDWVHAAWS